MQHLRAFFFFFLLSLTSFGQTSYLDSLKTRLEKTSDVKEQLSLLRLIGREHPDTDEKIRYANQLLELANEHDVYFYQHGGELQLGIGYRFKGDLTASLEHLLKSLEVATAHEDDKMLGQSYGEIATTYASQGDTRNSVDYINKAIGIFRKQQDTLNLSIALLNTGYDYYTLNELDSSLAYGEEAEFLITDRKSVV